MTIFLVVEVFGEIERIIPDQEHFLEFHKSQYYSVIRK